MDRRRLEDAHFKFACNQIALWYPSMINDIVFGQSLNQTLKEITPVYHKAFMKFYSSKIHTNNVTTASFFLFFIIIFKITDAQSLVVAQF